MKRLYNLARQIHLFAGLILALAILFYTVSGTTFVYAAWMPRASTQDTKTEIAVPPAASSSEGALQEFVANAAQADGRTDGFRAVKAGGFRQQWRWPSGAVEAVVSADTSTLTITRSQYGVLRTMRNFHTLRGANGGAGFALWWLLLDIVSLAMIAFAVTGFLLWYRSTKDRRLGWLLFGASWAYTIGLIAYLWRG